MAKRIYMPFYVKDWREDTKHLTLEQKGMYLEFLLEYWQQGGPLPDEKILLRRLVPQISRYKFEKNLPKIYTFFKRDGNFLRHKRVDAELEKAKELSEKGQDAAKARWGNSTDNGHAYQSQSQSQKESLSLSIGEAQKVLERIRLILCPDEMRHSWWYTMQAEKIVAGWLVDGFSESDLAEFFERQAAIARARGQDIKRPSYYTPAIREQLKPSAQHGQRKPESDSPERQQAASAVAEYRKRLTTDRQWIIDGPPSLNEWLRQKGLKLDALVGQ